MVDVMVCPTSEKLRSGCTADFSDEEFEEHLLICEYCARNTLYSAEFDTYLSALRERSQAVPSQSTDEFRHIDSLISRIQALRRNALTDLSSSVDLINSEAALVREICTFLQPGQQPDELGRLGPYRVLKLLGVGGMGGVFLAEDTQLKRRVALKVMRPGHALRSGAAERFLREARAAATLRHDHVVTIYQVGRENDVPYLAMELLEGESLEHRLTRESWMSVPEVLRVGREIAAGLAAAHAQGLIHRDIKPANIWLESRTASHATTESSPVSARAKLLDFGLARLIDQDSQLTSEGMIIGTPAYMAPEQTVGDVAEHAADLFSLGVVLYRMVTGVLPFRGKDAIATLIAVRTQSPPPPKSLITGLPSELSRLVMRLLAKEPTERPASASEVAEQLAGIEWPRSDALHENVEGPAPSVMRSKKLRQSIRRPAMIACAFVLCSLLAGVIVVETDGQRVELRSEVDDVDVVITQGGKEIKTFDRQTGSQFKWLASGEYKVSLKGNRNDVSVDKDGFKLTRWGKVILTLTQRKSTRADDDQGIVKLRSFSAVDPVVSKEGVIQEGDGWKVSVTEPGAIRLFEVADAKIDDCIVMYRAKMKTENVKGRAFLEMRARTPDGEFFSKGFDHVASGTTDWQEYSVPFMLQKGQSPDLFKLNIVVEGTGIIWVKDVEFVRGNLPRSVAAEPSPSAAWFPDWLSLKSVPLKKIAANEQPITTVGVTAENDGWKLVTTESTSIRLFEFPKPGVNDCVVIYRAKMKADNVTGQAFLEMFVRTPDGEFFSKGLDQAISRTTEWKEFAIPFILPKGATTDLIKLNVNIQGTGTVWIKDIELTKAELPQEGR